MLTLLSRTVMIAWLFVLAGCGRPAESRSAAEATLTLRFDYAGAEALLVALHRDSLSEHDVEALLAVDGVRAMVDNVTRFVPQVGRQEFAAEVRGFVRRKRRGEYQPYFQLADVWRERERVSALLDTVRAQQARIEPLLLSRLGSYRPDTGPLEITVYLVAGGVSDGFAFEHDARSFYVNLVRADGDFDGLLLNATHEAYHVMQMAAQTRHGQMVRWITDDSLPSVERVLAGTLVEGTANYVADPTRLAGAGADMEEARARYVRHATPERIAQNFALFDSVIAALAEERMDLREANEIGLSRNNDDRFYFVGYEMAKTLDRHCGAGCIAESFERPAVEFFLRYIELYEGDSAIVGRFSERTEQIIRSSR